jgi:uncharacterized membrane protein YoaK (UPF0700 family)
MSRTFAASTRRLTVVAYHPAVVSEAKLEQTDAGLVPASTGWFVMNARDARWFEKPGQGHSLPFTGHDEYEAETFFPMLGMAIRVMAPGEPSDTYHWETEQEDFLVLAGEGLLIVEAQERPLKQWDFVHCPPETRTRSWAPATGHACSCTRVRGSSRRTVRGASTVRMRRPPATTPARRRTPRTARSPTRGSPRRGRPATRTACCPTDLDTQNRILREIADTLCPSAGTADGVLPPLMVLLTVVTGVVDAVAYLRLGHVFVANMTGNVVFLGFSAAGASGLSVAGSLLAIACFLPGGVVAGRLAARLGDRRLHQLRAATGIQLILFAGAILVAAVARDDAGSGSRYALIALLALAMGVQNATARRLAVPDLTTTVLTLTLTGIAADSQLAGGSGANTGRRLISVAAMLLGATIGALFLIKVAAVASLALAAGIVAIVCLAAHRAAAQARPHVDLEES